MVISRSLLRITLLPAAVRKLAATRLGLRASPGNLRSLVRSLQDEDASVREASLESLVKLGPSSVPVLIRGVMTAPAIRARRWRRLSVALDRSPRP